MPKAYWVARISVSNEDRYPEYLKAGAPVYEKFDARFIVRGGRNVFIGIFPAPHYQKRGWS